MTPGLVSLCHGAEECQVSLTNQKPVLRSRDQPQPIRGQCVGHVISLQPITAQYSGDGRARAAGHPPVQRPARGPQDRLRLHQQGRGKVTWDGTYLLLSAHHTVT